MDGWLWYVSLNRGMLIVNILKALILTLAPPILGLTSYYLSLGDYTQSELVPLIGLQLYYINFRWLAISLILNLWLVSKLHNKYTWKPGPKFTSKPNYIKVNLKRQA